MLRNIFGCLCIKKQYDIEGRRYVEHEVIGQGGFSTVHLVTEVGGGRLYALKKIRCHSSEDERAALNEINYHKQISHPAVIGCLGSSVTGQADLVNNGSSIVMILLPFYKFGTLQSILEKRRPRKEYLNETIILSYFSQMCDGVRAIHNSGAAHRDLKPANILLASNDSIVIMDLGSMAPSRVHITSYQECQKLQDDAAERCSMTYRAPELFNVQSPCTIDERTDIWSLGCLLYALYFFKSPFDDVFERGDSVALASASGNVNYPEDSHLSQPVHNLISSMLTVDPQERPFIDDVISSLGFVKALDRL